MDPHAPATPRRSASDLLERGIWLTLLTANTAVWITAALNGARGLLG